MQSIQNSRLVFVFDDLMLSEACKCFARSNTFRFEEPCVDPGLFVQKERREISAIQLLCFSITFYWRIIFVFGRCFYPKRLSRQTLSIYVFSATQTMDDLGIVSGMLYQLKLRGMKKCALMMQISKKPTRLYNRHCSDLMELIAASSFKTIASTSYFWCSSFDACFCTSQCCQWCVLLQTIWQTTLFLL